MSNNDAGRLPAQNLGQQLNPASVAIDGRDLRDQLAFVAQFSRLLLYYNAQNQQQGDWQDFFLKDPAILLAAISKTDYALYHAQYLQLKQQLPEQALPTTECLSQLCRLLQKMFATLNLWLRNMRKHKHSFSLLSFLIQKIQTQLALQLNLFVLIQQALKLKAYPDLFALDVAALSLFEHEWQLGRGQSALIEAVHGESGIRQIIQQLTEVFEQCFDAMVQICDQAKQDFYQLEQQNCDFPDTALLRACLRLLDQQRLASNNLSQAHLQFYYQSILQTRAAAAKLDQVYLNLRLNQSQSEYVLPANSAFFAGTYADKSPIIFLSSKAVHLNRVEIRALHTEIYRPPVQEATAGLTGGWQFTRIDLAETIQKNAQGEPQDIPFWGNRTAENLPLAIAFASPMLVLAEGQRTLRFRFDWLQNFDASELWQTAEFYLSVENAWLAVTHCLSQVDAQGFQLDLPASMGAVRAFASESAEFNSQWPVLKMVFANHTDLSAVRQFKGLTIDSQVHGFSQVQLANDMASLPADKPAPVFATPAAQASNFYLSAPECFAKPLQYLNLILSWDKLPACLSSYYATYNYYLAGFPKQLSAADYVLRNSAYTLRCEVKQQGVWQDMTANCGSLAGVATAPYCVLPGVYPELGLFAIARPLESAEQAACTLDYETLPVSQYCLKLPNSFQPQADLIRADSLNQAMPAAAQLRFSLTGPVPGFGSSLYPAVVAALSLKNAQILIQQAKAGVFSQIWKIVSKCLAKLLAALQQAMNVVLGLFKSLLAFIVRLCKGTQGLHDDADASDPEHDACCSALSLASLCDDSGLFKLPPAPLNPGYTRFCLDYLARYQWQGHAAQPDETTPASAYPFEFYHWRPQGWCLRNAGAQVVPSVLDLLAQPEFSNACYLSLHNLVLPARLHIGFEISVVQASGSTSDTPLHCYLLTQPKNLALSIVHDETQGLRQSGIIEFFLPALPAEYTLCQTPDQAAWLVMPAPLPGTVVRLAYLAPQMIRAVRQASAAMPQHELPQIAPQTISKLVPAQPQISQIYQAFASFGGRQAEQADDYQSNSSYPLRVAQRLLHKDRAMSLADYAALSRQALPDLYNVMVLSESKGKVSLYPLRTYASLAQRHALRPWIEYDSLSAYADFMRARSSALVNLDVANPRLKVLQLALELRIKTDTETGQLSQRLQQGLQLYLSPWIASQQKQRQFAKRLTQTELLQFLGDYPAILGVESLRWRVLPEDTEVAQSQPFADGQDWPSDTLECEQSELLVSAWQHQLVLQASAGPYRDNGRIPVLAEQQELSHDLE